MHAELSSEGVATHDLCPSPYTASFPPKLITGPIILDQVHSVVVFKAHGRKRDLRQGHPQLKMVRPQHRLDRAIHMGHHDHIIEAQPGNDKAIVIHCKWSEC